MAYDLATAASKKLSQLGDKQLVVGEEKYGSGDDYVNSSSLQKLVDYATGRISIYLSCVKEGKGNPEVLLGDCENHLRFILAKLEQNRQQTPSASDLA